MNEKDKILIIANYLSERLRRELFEYERSYRVSLKYLESPGIKEINLSLYINQLKEQLDALSHTQQTLIDIEDLLYKLEKLESE